MVAIWERVGMRAAAIPMTLSRVKLYEGDQGCYFQGNVQEAGPK